MNQELKIMVGIVGSGKSTWAKQEYNKLTSQGYSCIVISRDEIRFSLLKDEEDYFAHEDEVFNEFIRRINESIELGFDCIIADATHVSRKARARVINRLLPNSSTNLVFEIMDCRLSTCVKRNSVRVGRAKVPFSAIKNMSNNFTSISLDEAAEYTKKFNEVYVNHHNNEGE
jgi:predicted kinase